MPILNKRANKTPLGLYVHVPFCRSKCQYCDFYSLACKDDKRMDAYINAVCAHIKEAGQLAPGYKVDTVYFGGGTPSYLGGDGLATILSAVRKYFDVTGDAEITFEANPDSISDKLLRRLRGEGFNRVSLGVQNDNDEMLKKLGRPHNYAQVLSAVQRIRKAGFKNLSLDLMYGLPGQTLTDWEKTLQHVLAINPEHMSCYGLKIEPNTPMYGYQDLLKLPDDDTQADMYLSAVEILKAHGFRQYEISNFARKGLLSRHNMKYWMGGEYLGFGPGAHSYFGGQRYAYPRDLEGYLQAIAAGAAQLEEIQPITPPEQAREYLMLRMRTLRGIEEWEYRRKFGLNFEPIARRLEFFESHHWAEQSDHRWHFTPQGFLLSNTLILELLDAQSGTIQEQTYWKELIGQPDSDQDP